MEYFDYLLEFGAIFDNMALIVNAIIAMLIVILCFTLFNFVLLIIVLCKTTAKHRHKTISQNTEE